MFSIVTQPLKPLKSTRGVLIFLAKYNYLATGTKRVVTQVKVTFKITNLKLPGF